MVSIEHLRAVPNDSLRRFIEAWLQWRGTAMLPRRAQLDLNQIKAMLPMVMLFELRAPDDVRFRVAGTGIARHLGFDPTGRNYMELTPEGQWPVRRYRLDRMAGQPCGGAMHHEDEQDLRRVAIAMLTLPLLPDEPDGYPLLFTHVAPLEEMPHPVDGTLARMTRLPDRFTFVDIGAGVPDAIEPTEG